MTLTRNRPMPPEVLVIVRPPPSKQNHPLNLQIQLVNPTITKFNAASTQSTEFNRGFGFGRSSSPSSSHADSFDAVASAQVTGTSSRRSSLTTATTQVDDLQLKRTPSASSSKSTKSNRSWSASSSASTTAFGAGRKVVPLYNLNFHAVTPTIITDAGTDEKLAKLLKRGGLDVVDLAILDPIELSNSISRTNTLSPIPSRVQSVSKTLTSPNDSSPSSFLGKFKRLSFKNAQIGNKPINGDNASTTTLNGLRVVPLFRTPSEERDHKPTKPGRGYAFTVRKWTRKDLEGPEGQALASSVTFEWRRASSRQSKVRTRTSKPDSPTTLATTPVNSKFSTLNLDKTPTQSSTTVRARSPARRNDTLTGEATTTDPNKLVKTPATPTSLSMTDSIPSGLVMAAAAQSTRLSPDEHNIESDDELDSDPEDSERPWTCHLVLNQPCSINSNYENTNQTQFISTPRRILLGTLTPAPHHPKLVGTLIIPSTLSPVAIGSFEPGETWSRNKGLTIEEMKDVVSITAFWLVVRDNLGGLRDRRRKGDGSGGIRLGGHH
ncbi:hypothetical protein OIO90_006564 [Microbotryomycetes sp. JL221]|nr:hypothetical protein OIO90_006564 [Microbotryomycetes sp. JL221]